MSESSPTACALADQWLQQLQLNPFSTALGCSSKTSFSLSALLWVAVQNLTLSLFQHCSGLQFKTSLFLSFSTALGCSSKTSVSLFQHCSGLQFKNLSFSLSALLWVAVQKPVSLSALLWVAVQKPHCFSIDIIEAFTHRRCPASA